MRQLVLGLLLIVLIAVGVGIYLTGSSPAGAVESEAPAVPAVDPAPKRPELVAPETGEPAAVTRPASEDSRSAVEVESRPAAAFAVPPEDGLQLLVVAADSGAALPHAVVSVIGQKDIDEETQMLLFSGGLDLDAFFARHGRAYRADAEGLVRVPRSQGMVACGVHEGYWGVQSLFEGNEEPLRFELGFDPNLLVRVQDEGGEPLAGFPVALRFSYSSEEMNLLVAETDADGLATLRHALPLLQDAGSDDAFVGLVLVNGEPIQTPINKDEFPTEPIVLTAPSVGQVAVKLLGADGKAFEETAFLQLVPAKMEGHAARARDALQPGTAPGGLSSSTEAGEALFPHVGLGLNLICTAATMRGSKPVSAALRGPSRSGETVTIELAFERSLPVLVLPIADEKGAPLVNAVVNGAARRTGPKVFSAQQFSRRSDEHGVLRIPLADEGHESIFSSRSGAGISAGGGLVVATPVGSSTVEVSTAPQRDGNPFAPAAGESFTLELEHESAAGRRGALVDFSFALQPGENPLPEARLLPTPLLFSGTVTDTAGQPIRATVIPHFKHAGRSEYRGEYPRAVPTGADGSFALHGWTEAEGLAAGVQAGGYIAGPPTPVERGSTDVHLIVERAGQLAGRILVDEDVPVESLQVRAKSEDESVPSRGAVQVSEDGSFVASSLLRVPHRLEIYVPSEEGPLFQARGQLPADEDQPHPDLKEIDLRGRLSVVRLEVSGPDGQPLAAQVHRRSEEAGSGADAEGYADTGWRVPASGQNTFLTTRSHQELRIQAQGFRRATLPVTSGTYPVVLEPGYPVRLSLDPAPQREELGILGVVARLGRPGNDFAEVLVGRDGSFVHTVPAPGTYTVELVLLERELGRVSVDLPLSIEVQDRPGQQDLRLPISIETIESLLKELR